MPSTLAAPVRESLAAYLLAIADDELIMGHRHSEWTGFAPDIESDVALSSIAQEEIGHSKLFYEQVCNLRGGELETLAFDRPPEAFRNAIFTERQNDDWGFSVVRLFLYDRADAVRLARLASCPIKPLADLARALHREEKYHLQFGAQWMQRLAQATSGARERIQAALNRAWPEAVALFEAPEGAATLASSGLVPGSLATQETEWYDEVKPALQDMGLQIPPGKNGGGGRVGHHSEDLRVLLDEMTSVWRSEPSAKW